MPDTTMMGASPMMGSSPMASNPEGGIGASPPASPLRQTVKTVVNAAQIPFQALSAITGIVDRPIQEFVTDTGTKDMGKRLHNAWEAEKSFGKESEYSERMRKLVSQKTGLPENITLPQWQTKGQQAGENPFVKGTIQNLHNWTENAANTVLHAGVDTLDAPSTALGGSGAWKAVAEHAVVPALAAAGKLALRAVPGAEKAASTLAPALRPSGLIGTGFQGKGLKVAQQMTNAAENKISRFRQEIKKDPSFLIPGADLGFDASKLKMGLEAYPERAGQVAQLAKYPQLLAEANMNFGKWKKKFAATPSAEEQEAVYRELYVKALEKSVKLDNSIKMKELFGNDKDWIKDPTVAKSIMEEGRGASAAKLLGENEKRMASVDKEAARLEKVDRSIQYPGYESAHPIQAPEVYKKMAEEAAGAIFDKETVHDLTVIKNIQEMSHSMSKWTVAKKLKDITGWRTEMMFVFPWAHSYGNVAWNTYKGGGVVPFVRGLKYANNPKLVPDSLKAIMEETGLEQHYAQEAQSEAGKALGKMGLGKMSRWSSNQIEQMEYGMRSSLMETMMKKADYKKLEAEVGKDVAPYLLAHDVDAYVGSYMNQPEVISLIKQVGSQFPQYHFVVTPQVVAKNLATHPERINLTTNLWNSVNANAEHTSSGSGTTLVPIGTNTGAGRLLRGVSETGPAMFSEEALGLMNYLLTGPSGVLGVVGSTAANELVASHNKSEKNDPIQQMGTPLAIAAKSLLPEAINAPVSVGADIAKNALHKALPHTPKDIQGTSNVLQSLLRAFGNEPFENTKKPLPEHSPLDTLLDGIKESLLGVPGIYSRKDVKSQK
jgi:hypothetical protein